ncbi:hypothetical protein [Cellulosilyticum sp. I15G10I2]|uniref:hypothetical protein n=1 Tax=Cellulosilyticum sp. I15G10I2 TaxID=1892843 RepID=UPI00085C9AD5|nr:hypothetical protein [Cellulosilyticum sp. I15G10I2]
MNKKDLVWYASYGSNMLSERLMCYINGGRNRFNVGESRRCRDTSSPIMSMPVTIPYNMYYAKNSPSWNGSAVSFLDITQHGKAYGVAYLITREQMSHIHREENGGHELAANSWYNMLLAIDSFDGIDIVTITSSAVFEKREPSAGYLRVLAEGLKEHYKYLSDAQVNAYILSRND